MSDEEVRQLSRKLDRVLDILNNDDETGEKGLVARVADLTSDFKGFVAQYNIDQAVKKGKATVWKIVWGAVGAAILKLISYLFHI